MPKRTTAIALAAMVFNLLPIAAAHAAEAARGPGDEIVCVELPDDEEVATCVYPPVS